MAWPSVGSPTRPRLYRRLEACRFGLLMVHMDFSVLIQRSPEDVFAFACDPSNYRAWQSDVQAVTMTSGAKTGLGATYEVRVKPFRRVQRGKLEIVAFQAPKTATVRGNAEGVRFEHTYTVTREGSGTRLRRSMDVTPPGVMRLLVPILSPLFRRRHVEYLDRLKKELEAHPSTARPVDRHA